MSRNSFKIAVELDQGDIEEVNRRLRRLPVPMAQKAMRNGFSEFLKRVRSTAKSLAPYGVNKPTEFVRGQSRPNPHIRDFLAYTVRTYGKGIVVWGAFGVKERRGTYETPHWYLRWVEFGHEIKRKATTFEQQLLKSRGEVRYKTIGIGRVQGRFFIKRSYEINSSRLLPIIEQKIADQIAKEWGTVG
jgi:hypothetical protein